MRNNRTLVHTRPASLLRAAALALLACVAYVSCGTRLASSSNTRQSLQNMIYSFLKGLVGEDYEYVDAYAFYDVFSLSECTSFELMTKENTNTHGLFSPVYNYRNPYEESDADNNSTIDSHTTEDMARLGNNGNDYNASKQADNNDIIAEYLPLGTLSSTFTMASIAAMLLEQGYNSINSYIASDSNMECQTGIYGSDALEKMKLKKGMIPKYLDVITGRFAYPMDFASNTYYNTYFPLEDEVYTVEMSKIITEFLKDADIPSPYAKKDKDAINGYYSRPPIFNEYNALLLDVASGCSKSGYKRDQQVKALAGDNNSFNFSSYAAHKDSIKPGRDQAEKYVTDKYGSDTRKTKYPLYKPVASYLLPATDLYMNMLGIANTMRALVCGGTWSSEKKMVINNYLMSILSPVYRIEAGDSTGTGYAMGFYQQNINGYDIWISDGNWPGWSNRLGVYIPQTGVGDVVVFFIQTNIKKNNKIRDAFTEYTVKHLISDNDLSGLYYRTNNPWKNHGKDSQTKSFSALYEPIRSIKKYILSSRLRIDDSIKFFDEDEYVKIDKATYAEIVPGILSPKMPYNRQINLIAYPDAANANYLVYGRDALVRQGTEGLSNVGSWQYYVLMVTIIVCIGILIGEIVLTVHAYKFYGAAMKEQKKLKKLEQNKMQKAKKGIVSTEAGAALGTTGLGAGLDDLAGTPEGPLLDMGVTGTGDSGMIMNGLNPGQSGVVKKKFFINNFFIYIIESSIVLFCILVSIIDLIIILVESNKNSVVDENYGIYKYGLCESSPSALYTIPVLDVFSFIGLVVLLALYTLQIIFYRKETNIIWLILVPVSAAIILTWFIWGVIWNHFSIKPASSVKCKYSSN